MLEISASMDLTVTGETFGGYIKQPPKKKNTKVKSWYIDIGIIVIIIIMSLSILFGGCYSLLLYTILCILLPEMGGYIQDLRSAMINAAVFQWASD